MKEQRTKNSKISRIIIVILAALLVISVGGLSARLIYLKYFAVHTVTVDVPNNVIGDDSTDLPSDSGNASTEPTVQTPDAASPAASAAPRASIPAAATPNSNNAKRIANHLELYKGQAEVNDRFEAVNLFPGDSETKYYAIYTYHEKPVVLYFKTIVTEQTKQLGDVLHIKVTQLDSGKVLIDAPFNEVSEASCAHSLPVNDSHETVSYFEIDVSLDTSVGNPYQAAKLIADFEWYITDDGLTDGPVTGDNSNLYLWIVLALLSLLMLIVLLWKWRKEEEHEKA